MLKGRAAETGPQRNYFFLKGKNKVNNLFHVTLFPVLTSLNVLSIIFCRYMPAWVDKFWFLDCRTVPWRNVPAESRRPSAKPNHVFPRKRPRGSCSPSILVLEIGYVNDYLLLLKLWELPFLHSCVHLDLTIFLVKKIPLAATQKQYLCFTWGI